MLRLIDVAACESDKSTTIISTMPKPVCVVGVGDRCLFSDPVTISVAVSMES
jgi:hypothetical protein